MLQLQVNGQTRQLGEDVDPKTPLLWVLRDHLGLGRRQIWLRHRAVRRLHRACGWQAHALLPDFRFLRRPARRSPPSKAWRNDGKLHRLQQAWIELDVAQCGYCQAGQFDERGGAAGRKRPIPPTRRSTTAMTGNICRCGTYNRIKAAIHAGGGPPGGRTRKRRPAMPVAVDARSCRSDAKSRNRSGLERRGFLKLGRRGGGLVLAFGLNRARSLPPAKPTRPRSTPLSRSRRTTASRSTPRVRRSARASRPPSA